MLYIHISTYIPKITNRSSSPKINNSLELLFYPAVSKHAALASRYADNIVLTLNLL